MDTALGTEARPPGVWPVLDRAVADWTRAAMTKT